MTLFVLFGCFALFSSALALFGNAKPDTGWSVCGCIGALIGAVGTIGALISSLLEPVKTEYFPVAYTAEPTSKEIMVYTNTGHTFRSERKIDFDEYTNGLPGFLVKAYNAWGVELHPVNFTVKKE